jgi:hypothetical protein
LDWIKKGELGYVACWRLVEFFKGKEEMVVVADYHCSSFLWDYYSVRQWLGNSTLYLHHILIWELSCPGYI